MSKRLNPLNKFFVKVNLGKWGEKIMDPTKNRFFNERKLVLGLIHVVSGYLGICLSGSHKKFVNSVCVSVYPFTR